MSPRRVVEALVWAHNLGGESFARQRMANLPGGSVTVRKMVEALGEIAGPEAVGRIRWEGDAEVQRIVGGGPAGGDVRRAEALGFSGDAGFKQIVRTFIADDL